MPDNDLRQRTKEFALRIMRLVDALPNSTKGRAIGQQIIRSATSVGANYRSACRGRTRAEFLAKMGICLEEADETAFWLELIADGMVLRPELVQPLLNEANQLTAILVASINTTKRRGGNDPKDTRG